MAKRAFLDVYQSQVATALAKAGTSLVLESVEGLSARNVLIIDEGTTKAEVIYVTSIDTLTKTATVIRALGDTSDVAHAKGAIVKKVGWKNTMTVVITDISTAETLCIVPPKGILTRATTVLAGAIATADGVVTLSKNTQEITNGVITIAYNGSAEGDIDECIPTLYNEFNGTTDYLKVVNGGACTNTFRMNLTAEFICLED